MYTCLRSSLGRSRRAMRWSVVPLKVNRTSGEQQWSKMEGLRKNKYLKCASLIKEKSKSIKRWSSIWVLEKFHKRKWGKYLPNDPSSRKHSRPWKVLINCNAAKQIKMLVFCSYFLFSANTYPMYTARPICCKELPPSDGVPLSCTANELTRIFP